MQKISSDYKWETFLSISPITGLGLCELSELCERLILSSVWAVLLHKAGGCSLRAPAPLRENSKSYWIFLRLAGVSLCAAIVRQAHRANRMISRRGAKAQGFLQWVSIGSSTFAGEICWGGSSLPRAKSKSTAPNIDQCLTR